MPAAFGGRDGADFFPGDGHGGFAAGVGELGAGVGAMLMEEVGDALELGDVLVFPDTEVGGGDAAFGVYRCGLCDDEAGTANGAASEVDEMPFVGESVDAGVFAHGGHGDAVGQDEAAELEGGEKMVDWLGHGF